MISSLNTYQAWMSYYEAKLRGVSPSKPSSLLCSTLRSVSRQALDTRASQLLSGSSYTRKKIRTVAAGLIPFLKPLVAVDACERFADEVLHAFGLGDGLALRELAQQFSSERHQSSRLTEKLLMDLTKLSPHELLRHLGLCTASEMKEIVDKGREFAKTVHEELLIPIVVEKMRAGQSELRLPERLILECPIPPPVKSLSLSVPNKDILCTRPAATTIERQPKTAGIGSTRPHHADALLSVLLAVFGMIGFVVTDIFWKKFLILLTYRTNPAAWTVPASPISQAAVCDNAELSPTPVPPTPVLTKERKRRSTSENTGNRPHTRRKSWTKHRSPKETKSRDDMKNSGAAG